MLSKSFGAVCMESSVGIVGGILLTKERLMYVVNTLSSRSGRVSTY